MRILVIIASALALSACCPQKIDLDARWFPLREVRQDDSQAPGVLSTRGDVVLAGDLCAFARLNPDERHACLLHEQHHAIRQAEDGLANWTRDFNASTQFRWAEESAGWSLQIRDEVAKGVVVDPARDAAFLSGPAYGGMVGYDFALSWVLAEIAVVGVIIGFSLASVLFKIGVLLW